MATNKKKSSGHGEKEFIVLKKIPGGQADLYCQKRMKESKLGVYAKLPKDSSEFLDKFIDVYGVNAVSNMDTVNIGNYVYDKGINYSMNINVGRNTAWLEDGLKSVERRAIWTMYDRKAYGGRSTKVASISGAMMETVYPHGNQSAEDTIYRLGRSRSTMIPYIKPGGNFGNMETNRPASARYASGSLTPYAYECFFSEMGSKNAIFEVKDNYQYTGKEPVYLTTKYPNVLMQWNLGIGKGLSYMIGGFNSKELLRATVKLIDNPNAKIDIYPDAPIPIDIINKSDLKGCFDKQRYQVVMRAKYEFRVDKKKDQHGKIVDKHIIVFTSLPLNVIGDVVFEEIRKIKREDRSKPLSSQVFPEVLNVEMSANSTPGGIEFIVEYEKGYDPQSLVEKLFRSTSLQKTYGVNNTMITDNKPVRYTPRDILLYWIAQRHDNKRRYYHQSALKAAKDRASYEAIMTVLATSETQDKAISIIKSSKNDDESIRKLAKEFNLTTFQTGVIVRIRLGSFAKMNIADFAAKRDKAIADYKYYRKLLSNDKEITAIIKQELEEAIKKYGIDRKADVFNLKQHAEDAKDEYKLIFYNNDQFFARTEQIPNKDNGYPTIDTSYRFIQIKNKDTVVLINKTGHVKIVDGFSFTKSETGINFSQLGLHDVVSIIPLMDASFDIVLVTANGYGKRIGCSEVIKSTKSKIITMGSDDVLVGASLISDKSDGLIAMRSGSKLYYAKVSDFPKLKRVAAGNRILKITDTLDQIYYLPECANYIVAYGEYGYIKLIDATNLKFNKRKPASIDLQGKTVLGLISVHGKNDTVAVHSVTGMYTIQITVDKMVYVTQPNSDTIQKFRIGNAISSPVKVLKKGRGEYYHLENVTK